MELPKSYDEAVETVRTIFMLSLRDTEASAHECSNSDALEDYMWQDLMNASHRFTGSHQFDLDWCVNMLKSKPGLSEESLETQSAGSVEEYIHEVLRVKIYDQLELEYENWIPQRSRSLKPSAPSP